MQYFCLNTDNKKYLQSGQLLEGDNKQNGCGKWMYVCMHTYRAPNEILKGSYDKWSRRKVYFKVQPKHKAGGTEKYMKT
jgi:hypothetical protein